ncbi:lysoplasmalogenase [Flavobacteriaceae bacterium LMO-SS05]
MMLTKTEKQFALVFTLIVLLELVFSYFETLSPRHYVTKPLIVLSLMFYFLSCSKTLQKPIRNVTTLALICALAGDILLMFDDHNPLYFIFGLVAFLMAHVFYIIVYLKHRNKSRQPFPFIVALLIFATGLFYLILDGLGDLLIPVVVYILVILTMTTTAFMRKGRVTHHSYVLVFLGALLFMISDSLLSLNMFYKPFPFANIGIMVTYALAQFFIVLGILKLKD